MFFRLLAIDPINIYNNDKTISVIGNGKSIKMDRGG
jgi:hypothetical protein